MRKIIIEKKELKYKINYKNIKHLYIRIKDNYIEINANKNLSLLDIEKAILKNKKFIISRLNIKREYFLFGKEKKFVDDTQYKKELPPIIFQLVKKYEKLMNIKASNISFKYNKTRWGSCSYKNSIIFNYYLAKLPIRVIEYVVVHELAHIKYKNHSKDFWNEVEKFLPNYKELKILLREYEGRIK